MNLLIHAVASLLTPFLLIGSSIGTAFVPAPVPASIPIATEVKLGASEAIPTTIAFFETTLASAISSSATTFTLTSATDKDGTTLASSTYAFVIDEGSSNEEIVIADCTATACINAERGISVRTGNTEVTALKKAHRRGASVKITDAPILPLLARISRGEEGIPSASYYNSTVSTSSFSNDQQLVSKGYVDYLAFNGAGVIDALETSKGVVELATTLEQASSTPSGSSGPLVLQAKNATSTYNSATAANRVLVTGSGGKLDTNFIDNFASTTLVTVGDTPILNIGSYVFATNTPGTSTWSVPAGIKRIKVTLTGPGGKGGDVTNSTQDAGGGGAGGTAIKWYDVSATSTLQFHIGVSGVNTDFSWFGGSVLSPVMTARTGENVGQNGQAGGQGGTATGGNLNLFGGGGGSAPADAGESGGIGGGSYWGGGARSVPNDNDGASAATEASCGAGGSGATGNSAGARGGGLGAPGCILIEF